jgi:hypothetical protein
MTRHEPLETFTNYLEYVILWFVGCRKDAHLFRAEQRTGSDSLWLALASK